MVRTPKAVYLFKTLNNKELNLLVERLDRDKRLRLLMILDHFKGK